MRTSGRSGLLAVVVAAMCISGIAPRTAMAGQYEDGLAAFQRGDCPEALRLLKPLAEQANEVAQVRVGDIYHLGQCVPRDDAEAVAWFRKAADQGNAVGQLRLGAMYYAGQGVAQDNAEGDRWIRKAADQGLAFAQSLVGELRENGIRVAQNYAEAVEWYRKAANQGEPNAQLDLSGMYYNGKGVAQDYVAALMWMSLAAGSPPGTAIQEKAMKARDLLTSILSQSQVADAQRMARAWKPGQPTSAQPASAAASGEEDPVSRCSKEMARQPRFADIATKMPLADIRQISFAMLANEGRPTEKERKAIAEWFDGHESCRRAGDQYRRTQYPPDIYSLLQDGETKMRVIGTDLYNKKISYGEADKRFQQLYNDIEERLGRVVKEYQAAAASQKALAEQRQQQQQSTDDARQAQQQALDDAQQAQAETLRQQRAMLFLQSMRANQSSPVQFHPIPVSPSINCTSQQIGNSTFTNCR